MTEVEPVWVEKPKFHRTEVAARAMARERYDPMKNCEKCGGVGVFFKEVLNEFREGGWYETVPCECFLSQSQASLLRQCGIPEVYLGATLDTWNNTGRGKREIAENSNSVLIARNVIERLEVAIDDGLQIWISGTEGTGKTWVAASILRAARIAGYPARFFSAVRLVKHSIEHRDDFENFYDVEWLVLDGIDAMPPTKSGYEVSLVHDLIRERVQNRMPTIYTAHLPLSKCGEAFVEDIRSLLIPVTVEMQFVGKPFKSGNTEIRDKWNT